MLVVLERPVWAMRLKAWIKGLSREPNRSTGYLRGNGYAAGMGRVVEAKDLTGN